MRLVPPSDDPKVNGAVAAARQAALGAALADDDVVLLLAPAARRSLTEAIGAPGGRAMIETDGDVRDRAAKAREALSAGAEFAVALSTATAFRTDDVTVGISAGLVERWPDLAPLRDQIRAALHEALMNAVVHGNLGVAGVRMPERRELDTHFENLDRRLARPDLAQRTVLVSFSREGGTLRIAVTDDGGGFDQGVADSRPLTPEERAMEAQGECGGRGFMLMAGFADQVEISCGGRRTTLTFAVSKHV